MVWYITLLEGSASPPMLCCILIKFLVSGSLTTASNIPGSKGSTENKPRHKAGDG